MRLRFLYNLVALSLATLILVSQPALSQSRNAAFVSQAGVPAAATTGQSFTVALTFRNTGTTTWSTSARYALGSSTPSDNTTWGYNRIALPNAVAPGQSVSISVSALAPQTAGTYAFQWRMVQDGSGGGWFGSASTLATIVVQSAPTLVRDAVFEGQTGVPQTVTPGQQFITTLTFRNTGTTTWTTSAQFGLGSSLDATTWGTNRVALPSPVAPGQSVSFLIYATAPQTAGNYSFQWRMVQDGQGGGWFGSASTNTSISVQAAQSTTRDAAFEGQTGVPQTVTPGQQFITTLTFRNTGTTTWTTSAQFRLGSSLDATTWGPNRVALPSAVAPGQSVSFLISATAPQTAGNYAFQWRMVQDGQGGGWFGSASTNTYISVQPAQGLIRDAVFVGQSGVPQTVSAGRQFAATLTFRNTGTTTWTASAQFALGSWTPQDNTHWGLARVALPHAVLPGESANFTVTATAPQATGNYVFHWRMIQEGQEWFGQTSTLSNVTVSTATPALHVGGSNYIYYKIAYLQSPCGTSQGRVGFTVLDHYHLNSRTESKANTCVDGPRVKDIVRQQLRDMYADGQRRLRVQMMLCAGTDCSAGVGDGIIQLSNFPGDNLPATVNPTYLQNLRDFLTDARIAGFEEVVVGLWFLKDSDPASWQCGLDCNLTAERLYNAARQIAQSALDPLLGIPVKMDLQNEAFTVITPTPAMQSEEESNKDFRRLTFMRKFWELYTRDFPPSTSIGFSFVIDNNAEVVSGRLRTAQRIFGSTPPAALDFHIYHYDPAPPGYGGYSTGQALSDALDALNTAENSTLSYVPIIIGESYYDDYQSATEIRNVLIAKGRSIKYLLQWPLKRNLESYCGSGHAAFEICATPPPFTFGNYRGRGF